MIKKINNKGFTMIELLTVIVLIGIIMSITIYSVIPNIDKSKEEVEKVFVNNLNNALETFIDKNKNSFIIGDNKGTIDKVINTQGDTTSVNVYEIFNDDGELVQFSDVISTGFLKERDFINPKNEVKCNINTSITIYRDDDFVYYYKYDLLDSCGADYDSLPSQDTEEDSDNLSSSNQIAEDSDDLSSNGPVGGDFSGPPSLNAPPEN